jgi:hypothetical protein
MPFSKFFLCFLQQKKSAEENNVINIKIELIKESEWHHGLSISSDHSSNLDMDDFICLVSIRMLDPDIMRLQTL